MPKKWHGPSGKAAEALAKKNEQKTAEKERLQKQIEDEYWRDDDKNLQRKQQRKEEKEKKRQEQVERKRENSALLEQEMSGLKSGKPAPPPSKITQFEIQANRAKAEAEAAAEMKEIPYDQRPIEENVNRMAVEGESARSVAEAINVLSVTPLAKAEVKMDYGTFEQKRLAQLKEENPNMRLSQLKQMVKKEWMRSPENPINQRV